jgi:hypothetical protein
VESLYRGVTPFPEAFAVEDGDLLTAAEVSRLFKVGRNFPYQQLRSLAVVISRGAGGRETLRWSRQRLEKWLAGGEDGNRESLNVSEDHS